MYRLVTRMFQDVPNVLILMAGLSRMKSRHDVSRRGACLYFKSKLEKAEWLVARF
jgi:hypothetical protein